MSITVRAARPEELEAVGGLCEEAYRVEGYLDEDPTAQAYVAKLRDAAGRARDARLLVAVDAAGAVVGTITYALAGTPWAQMAGPGEAELRMLAVDPGARGRGVAEALTRRAVAEAAEAGARRVVLCSLPAMHAAHRLYERLGFSRTPELDWADGEVALLGYALSVAATRPGSGPAGHEFSTRG
ncbi:L-amino acid N-acyltransferase YncA [Kineococcus xinjiangensis]|uniref:L-amino acid N-acyltransferase YncA n=1 Tax=Kineococcus xinjiangensis TaxID=512762 RepID=A0A2S6IW86_9ACTN|nr:GNAT family N-acetyltransferase [Kineococcus xinjiangensis]PPK98622.1 L-amino acid N-acyltransferase YncA [Kineococcus xinjiangensis]